MKGHDFLLSTLVPAASVCAAGKRMPRILRPRNAQERAPHRKWIHPLIAVLTVLLTFARAAESQVTTPHPVPWEFASDRYAVTVNGAPLNVFFAAMNLHFASFDFTGQADVQVTINENDYHRHDGKTYLKPDEFWQSSATVRPLSRGIQPKTDGRKVTFSLTKPGQYSIERPGTGGFEDEVLFLFANPPEKNIPRQDDPKVVWLSPGTHQRSVDLTSGQTLYLAPGAVLYGAINVWDAENVRICGRGVAVYNGPNSRNVDSGWMCRPNWHPLTTHNVKNLAVEGVTFVNRARTWSLQFRRTTDSTFDNIKVIASTPENLNCDGMDWYGGGRAVVRDSFIRSADDCLAIFAEEASEALRVDRGGGGHLPGAPQRETPPTRGKFSGLTVERCVFWPTVANILRAGWSNQSLTTSNVTIRDCDVIHSAGLRDTPWMGADWALFTTVIPQGEGICEHRDYLFEDIRIEHPFALLGVNWPQATLRNFHFRNVRIDGAAGRSFLRASADGIVFENVRVNGCTATCAADINLTTEGDAKCVRFGLNP